MDALSAIADNEKQVLLRRYSRCLVSAAILTFMSLQIVTAADKLCPLGLFSKESKAFCDPNLYPFLHYPMYSKPMYEGHQLTRYRVIGILADSSEITLEPEDIGLNFWLFEQQVVQPILNNNNPGIVLTSERYGAAKKVSLTAIRLENHPTIVTKKGSRSGEIEVVKTIDLKSLRARK